MDPNKDMCIEIKLGKSESSNDKKLAATGLGSVGGVLGGHRQSHYNTHGGGGAKSGGGGSGTGAASGNEVHRWDPERTVSRHDHDESNNWNGC